MRVLVRYDDNWSDEMDISGFVIFKSNQDWESFLEEAKVFFEEHPEGYTYYVGTNEEIHFENFEDYESRLTAHGLSDEAFKDMKEIFGSPQDEIISFGFWPELP